MKRIGVFCGSSAGACRDYTDAARTLAAVLVERGIGLVYGGGRVGLMGRIAEAVVGGGGEVIGVIPRALVDEELAFRSLADLRVVDSMQERKLLMATLSDAFIALPGGFGTLDELVEMLTWTQLGIHRKPCGLLNTRGYYDGLMAFVDHSVAEGFVQPEHRLLLVVDDDAANLVERVKAWTLPEADKSRWIRDLEDA